MPQHDKGLRTGGLQSGGLSTGSLQTGAQGAEQKLFQQAGKDFSPLEPGGFARRDRVRQSIRESTLESKRLSRATNLAYRDAIRRGDRAGALDILLKTGPQVNSRGEVIRQGIQFGGVRAAQGDRERVIQNRGEEFITAQQREQQAQQGAIAHSEVPFGTAEEERKAKNLAFRAGGLLGGGADNLLGNPDFEQDGNVAQTSGPGDGANLLNPTSVRGKQRDKEIEALGGGRAKENLFDRIQGVGLSIADRFKGLFESSFNPGQARPLASSFKGREVGQTAEEFNELSGDEQERLLIKGRDNPPSARPVPGRARRVQEVGRFEPFTGEAINQRAGSSQSLSEQQKFFSNAERGLGRGIRSPAFKDVRKQLQDAVFKKEVNPRFAAQYLSDVADVFKSYESMKSSGVSDKIPSPPSKEEMRQNSRALFDWVAKVKEQRLKLKRESSLADSLNPFLK